MARLFLLVTNVLLAACMIIAVPALIFFLLAFPAFQGARAVARKISHRQPHWTRTRRKARPDLYPETAL